MFSKRLLTIVFLVLFALLNIILLSISAGRPHGNTVVHRAVMAAVSPFQEGVTQTIDFCEGIWTHYFHLVSVRQECDRLSGLLAEASLEKGRYLETEATCERLRRLVGMKSSLPQDLVAAQVIGLDPSGWFKAVIINKGTDDGVDKGMPVIAPEGIVGQIVTASGGYSKVMLAIDPNSAVDALVQRTRTRGIVEGESEEVCRLKYVVRKAEIDVGDVVISSGLDGLFPKGLRIGNVVDVSKAQPDIFQTVKIRPFVDFATLEEVLVIRG